jgi:O-acetylserine/cysteine efflux transporter
VRRRMLGGDLCGVSRPRVLTTDPVWRVRLSLAAMVVYFGSSFTAYGAAERSFGFVTANAARFAIAAVILGVAARGHLAAVRAVWGRLVVAGALGVGLMAIMMAYGVDRSTPTLAALVFALESVGVATAAAVLAGERPSRMATIGLATGLAGSVVAAGAVSQPLGSAPVAALAAMLTSVVLFSVYTAVVRRIAPANAPLAVAAVTQFGALLISLPLLLLDVADRGLVRGPVTVGAVAGVVFIGAGSALAYFLIASVLSRAPASRLAIALYLLPVVGVATAWLLLGQRPYLRDFVGGGLILAAVFLGEHASRIASGGRAGRSEAAAQRRAT